MFGISFLTGRLVAGIGGVLLVLVILSGCYATGRHAGKVAQDKHYVPILADLNAQIANWKSATGNWKASAEASSASVLRIKAAADAKVAAADLKVKAAQRTRRKAEASADALMHAELQGTTLERWQQADALVVKELR